MFNHFGLFCNLFFAGKPFSPKHHGSWVRLCCGYACDTNAQNMFHFVQGEMCLFSWLFWNVTDYHSRMRHSYDNNDSNSHCCSCFMLMPCLVEGGSIWWKGEALAWIGLAPWCSFSSVHVAHASLICFVISRWMRQPQSMPIKQLLWCASLFSSVCIVAWTCNVLFKR